MEKHFFNTILQNINVVDENGLGYDISLLPEAKKEYENYKNRCLANEWSDSHFDEWSDADTLKFIRKSSLVEFIDDPAKRKQAILENKANVYFPVSDNKSASNEMPWNEIHQLNGVEKYNSLIVAAAKEYSLDPDLLRAIVYMETTHGYYDNAISNVFRAFNLTPNYIPEGVNKSILPMNINTQFWGDNFGSREQLRIPEYNIYAGAKHLKQLQNAVGGFDIEKIATLYNNLSARRINDYGKRVAKLYQEKPWINPPSLYNYNESAPLLNFLRALLISTYTLCPSLFSE